MWCDRFEYKIGKNTYKFLKCLPFNDYDTYLRLNMAGENMLKLMYANDNELLFGIKSLNFQSNVKKDIKLEIGKDLSLEGQGKNLNLRMKENSIFVELIIFWEEFPALRIMSALKYDIDLSIMCEGLFMKETRALIHFLKKYRMPSEDNNCGKMKKLLQIGCFLWKNLCLVKDLSSYFIWGTVGNTVVFKDERLKLPRANTMEYKEGTKINPLSNLFLPNGKLAALKQLSVVNFNFVGHPTYFTISFKPYSCIFSIKLLGCPFDSLGNAKIMACVFSNCKTLEKEEFDEYKRKLLKLNCLCYSKYDKLYKEFLEEKNNVKLQLYSGFKAMVIHKNQMCILLDPLTGINMIEYTKFYISYIGRKAYINVIYKLIERVFGKFIYFLETVKLEEDMENINIKQNYDLNNKYDEEILIIEDISYFYSKYANITSYDGGIPYFKAEEAYLLMKYMLFAAYYFYQADEYYNYKRENDRNLKLKTKNRENMIQ